MFKNKIILLCLLLLPIFAKANKDSCHFFKPSQTYNKSRFCAVLLGEGAFYVGGLAALNSLWYKDYPRTSFHSFNDNSEWLQMDKVGHAYSAYQLTRTGISLYKWTGVKKNLVYGTVSSLLFLSSIEILDGFSSAWGASSGDVVANVGGCGLASFQELAWQEQRIQVKFSYSPSKFAAYRPNVLGANFTQQLFKDYNAQTYWLSINPASFIKSSRPNFLSFLNVAIGYGANGMIGGSSNPLLDNNGIIYPVFNRYRQFYISADIDLSRMKTKSEFLNKLLGAFSCIKIPFPGIEFNNNKGFLVHPFIF